MSTENPKKDSVSARKYHWSMDKVALFTVLMLSILGIGITNFRPLESYRYWGGMTVILAITAIVIGWARSKRIGKPVREMFITQAVHWTATAVTVAGIFLLLNMGRLNYENTGLILLVILGLSTFLDGYRISWSFSLIGVMMFVTGLFGGYLESYVWITLIVLVCVFVIIILLEKYKKIPPAPAEDAGDSLSG